MKINEIDKIDKIDKIIVFCCFRPEHLQKLITYVIMDGDGWFREADDIVCLPAIVSCFVLFCFVLNTFRT